MSYGADPFLLSPSEPSKSRMTLVAWRPMKRNTLRGFANVELPIGLRIFDIPVHEKNGNRWASLPGRPQIQDGRHRIGEDGKPAYSPVMEWASRELRDGFSARVVDLVADRYPETFDVGKPLL